MRCDVMGLVKVTASNVSWHVVAVCIHTCMYVYSLCDNLQLDLVMYLKSVPSCHWYMHI